ncbi:hypothetical protein Acsp04_21090 [Actinomadura sp. NBRC 104425]|uniref:hypothetical protein n=1 Tax=Actinomadura sp. NBRC 104425 TaxID=3032204 RepID=UPI0024A2B671|nr:hypothetical protein [Actinomadura sp. NBRC 104425]GLZ11874.1 hypothetical protein Acsp04_21090 [Actinomadura sp. NBRC 104425]
MSVDESQLWRTPVPGALTELGGVDEKGRIGADVDLSSEGGHVAGCGRAGTIVGAAPETPPGRSPITFANAPSRLQR